MGQLGGGELARSSVVAGTVPLDAESPSPGAASGWFWLAPASGRTTLGGVGDFTLSGVTELTSMHSGMAADIFIQGDLYTISLAALGRVLFRQLFTHGRVFQFENCTGGKVRRWGKG